MAGATTFADVWTYVAAGERLNAGHELYRLNDVDRSVPVNPPFYSAPLLSPPLVAVAWRPLVALPEPIGLLIWYAGVSLAVTFGIVAVFRIAPAAACLIAPSAGVLLGSGNLHAFVFATGVLVWRYRTDPWPAVPLALMTTAKLVALPLAATFVAQRNVRALLTFVAATAVSLTVGIVGAGWLNHVAYLGVIGDSRPQPASLSYLTGIPWLSQSLFAIATLVACALRPARAFQLGVVATALLVPGLGFAAVTLVGLLVLPRSDGTASSAVEYPLILSLIALAGAISLRFLVVI